MKIENTGSSRLTRADLAETQAADGTRAKAAGAQAASAKDRLELSEQAQTLAKARAALANQPEIRADKVQELRQAVTTGTYQVPHAQLVRRLVARL